MNLSSFQLDRAAGAVLASAAGDALGSQYEFGGPLPDTQPVEFGRGHFGHAPGEWTDDTSMAIPLLQHLADGHSLQDPAVLGEVTTSWKHWAKGSRDVGIQISRVLGMLGHDITEERARDAAARLHEESGRSAGNGSLMRTGPVALGHLEDGQEQQLIEAVGRVVQLTHWERDNIDACVIWSLAIRHAIRTGELDVPGQVAHLPEDRRERWAALIAEAMAPGATPRHFGERNGWVVRAFQGALAAVTSADSLVGALEAAIRGGHDTDTVAAIAGSLAGARYGASAVPAQWQVLLHGWPGLRGTDLVRLAVQAAKRGGTHDQWPLADREQVYPRSDFLARHPHDHGVWIGSLAALDRLHLDAPEVDAVVSLCRVGARQVPESCASVQVWLVDQPDKNLNLSHTLASAAQAVADLRAQGHTVFLHCAEGRSRTAAVATLYGATHHGVEVRQAWGDVAGALPGFAPQQFLVDAVEALCEA